jgi:NTE family protein
MPLSANDFIVPVLPRLRAAKAALNMERATELVFTTPEGKRLGFVDVVIEGGGVKGIATLGALYALEFMGFRFRKIAGTSSGALIAAFLAAAGANVSEHKVESLIEVLANIDFLAFADGGADAQAAVRLLNTATTKNNFRQWLEKSSVALTALRNFNEIVAQLGLNPGGRLLTFLCNGLAEFNGGNPLTVGALRKKWAFDPTRIDGKPLERDFQVVATDISHRQKVTLPRDLPEFVHRPDEVLIGDLVRASTSIPLFFAPVRLSDFSTPQDNLKAPPHIMFLDGGIVSNFPMSIFDLSSSTSAHERRRPLCPTFGLLIDELMDIHTPVEPIDNPAKFGLAMFLTATEHGDKSYIKSSPHNESRIIHISNTVAEGRKVTVLNFGMTDLDKIHLFENGVNAVIDKMTTWNFREYVKLYRSDVPYRT